MNQSLLIVAGIIVIAAVIVAAILIQRRRRPARLRSPFGPEYDRRVGAKGQRGTAGGEHVGRSAASDSEPTREVPVPSAVEILERPERPEPSHPYRNASAKAVPRTRTV